MAAIPEPQNSLVAAIDAAHQARQEEPRLHFGASQAGHHCDRWLWLSWRWAVIEKFSGRILRLFRRGQNEEASVLDDLRAAGVVVSDTDDDGRQHRVDFGAHLSGSMDGIISGGLPHAPKSKAVLEIKTHSLKSFKDVAKHGVEKSKPQHYGQMQLYMEGTGIDRALYYAVCKDDDSIYTEWVRADKAAARRLIDRSERIIASDRMPEPVSADPTWYQCRWCAGHAVCHGGEPVREVNCRTCAHSTAAPNGWVCAVAGGDVIPDDVQHQGCRGHVIHPDMVPWRLTRSVGEWSAAYLIDGAEVIDGGDGVDSRDLLK